MQVINPVLYRSRLFLTSCRYCYNGAAKTETPISFSPAFSYQKRKTIITAQKSKSVFNHSGFTSL